MVSKYLCDNRGVGVSPARWTCRRDAAAPRLSHKSLKLSGKADRADLLHSLLFTRGTEFVAGVPGRQLLGVGGVAGHIEGKLGQRDKA